MKQKLFGRISKDNILELCFLTQGDKNDHRKEEFYRLTFDEDNRVAFNALHVLSNFDLANNEWLYSKHDELIDRVMKEEHVGKRRLMLSILLRHTSTANRRLAIVLWLQGAGVLAAWLLPGIGGLLTGGLLVGGGFLCAVQLSLLYGRELAPNHTRYMAGLLTTGYAIGQLIGPMTSALSTWLTHRLEPALGLAGVALFVGGALVWNRQAERQQQLQ